MTFKKILFICLILSMHFISIPAYADRKPTDKYSVSIPVPILTNYLQFGNRITGYKLHISTGRIYSLIKIKRDWWIHINPELEEYQLEAEAGHGASWMTKSDIENGSLSEFLVIEIDPQSEESVLPELSVDLAIDSPDKEEEKHVIIGNKDILFIPLSQ